MHTPFRVALLAPLLVTITATMLLLPNAAAVAQSDALSPADSIMLAAIRLIDSRDVERARTLLREGERRFPDHPGFPYERAYIHYMLGEYAEAEEIVEKLITHDSAQGLYYQLLGNCKDMLGNPLEAIDTYERGLKRFPNSGPLHLERGIMAYNDGDVTDAMRYWERGISRDATFPSNYYHVARVYLGSTKRGWGILYGELFLLLEPYTQRSDEIRSLLYQAWNDALHTHGEVTGVGSDTVARIDLFPMLLVEIDPETQEMRIPFETHIFPSFAVAAIAAVSSEDTTVSVGSLAALRETFAEFWFRDEKVSSFFDIDVFALWRDLADEDLLEAYTYWVLDCPASKAEYLRWVRDNKGAEKEMLTWLRKWFDARGRTPTFSRLKLKGMPASSKE